MARPQRQLAQDISPQAPVQGLEAATAAFSSQAGMSAALALDNLIPRELGCEVRPGSREYAYNLGTGTGGDPRYGHTIPGVEVRTIVFYNDAAGATFDHMFALTADGIWDITVPTAPVEVLTWPNAGGDAGWATYVNFTNIGGQHYVLLADEANGYWAFDGSTWSQPTISGVGAPDVDNLVSLCEWQSRIWLVERGSADLWYLDLGAMQGDVTPIRLGSRFQKGGNLVQAQTWTLDDGGGMDDRLVCISSEGDLLAFSGIDPDNANNFKLDGRWIVGRPPAGRRVLSHWGGDVTVLTTFGIFYVSRLLAGKQIMANTNTMISRNITRFFREEMRINRNERGWSMEQHPQEGIVVYTVPHEITSNRKPRQFVVNLNTGTWCRFVGLDMRCCAEKDGRFYYGTNDGRVMELTGFVDGVQIDPPPEAVLLPIEWSLLTHYDPLGAPARNKQVQFIRPNLLSDDCPNYDVAARYDFDLEIAMQVPARMTLGGDEWDNAIWDQSIWSGRQVGCNILKGGAGMGRQVAIAMVGSSSTATTLLGFNLLYTQGNQL